MRPVLSRTGQPAEADLGHAEALMEAPVQADVYGLIATIVRIEASLRMLAYHPTMYPADGHYARIENLLTVLGHEVHNWMDGTPRDHRQAQRRQEPNRRVGPERRSEPPDPEAVA